MTTLDIILFSTISFFTDDIYGKYINLYCFFYEFLPIDVPKLPPLQGPQDEEDEKDEVDSESQKVEQPKKPRKTSGPKSDDPYANDDTSMLFPICIAIGVFLPTLFCLCRL